MTQSTPELGVLAPDTTSSTPAVLTTSLATDTTASSSPPHHDDGETQAKSSHDAYLASLRPPSREEWTRISSEQTRKEKLNRETVVQDGANQNTQGEEEAAKLIQRTYRGYRTRREMAGMGLSASTRWAAAVRELRWRETTRPRAKSSTQNQPSAVDTEEGEGVGAQAKTTAARHNWKLASVVARRANGDDESAPGSPVTSDSESSSNSSSSDEEKRAKKRAKRAEAAKKRREEARMMGLQYFLEMVDVKHRYGANLRTYHEEWARRDTQENFFYWLDHGEGQLVDMDACPREQLDKEMVRYLSREERQYYLVDVDRDGRLRWKKNGALIDTTEKYKDSIHGIVPADDPEPAWKSPYAPKSPNNIKDSTNQDHDDDDGNGNGNGNDDAASTTSSSSSSTSDSSIISNIANEYATPEFDSAKGVHKVKHITAATIFNKMLRKSVRKNTWIFVADTNFRLYVGIKDSGAFQHSSFRQGGRISAAGLIQIKNGRLRGLSPLSGHYRPPAANFRAFTKTLKEQGVNMKRVRISKAYAVLIGLEVYMSTRRKAKNALTKLGRKKEKILDPKAAKIREEAEVDHSKSAARERQVVEAEEERMREENKASAKLMQKLNIRPTEPIGQKGGGDYEEQATAERK